MRRCAGNPASRAETRRGNDPGNVAYIGRTAADLARLVENLAQALEGLGLVQRFLNFERKLALVEREIEIVEFAQVHQRHLRQCRIGQYFERPPLIVDFEFSFGRQGAGLCAQFEAAVNTAGHDGVGMAHVKVHLGEFGDDVGRLAPCGDHVVNPREVGGVLAQKFCGVRGDFDGVEGRSPLVRGAGRMGRLSPKSKFGCDPSHR